MRATTSIEITEQTITHPATGLDGNETRVPGTGQAGPNQNEAKEQGKGKQESELRAAARRKGLTLKEVANLMGVSYAYLSQVSAGSRPWSPMLRERAMTVLGEVPGQGVVYRHGGLVQGGPSTCIRERAREVGLSMGALADLVGVSRSYMSQASRGKRHFSPGVQARVEAVLEAPARVEAAQCPTVDPRALWDRMDAHGWGQNETARRAGISTGHLSLIMNGQRTPSGEVLRHLHEVLFQPTAAELVVPAEVKVMAWKKGKRNGVVVKGSGGPHSGSNPGGGTVRIGGRVPWGAQVEYAYTSGYDSRGRLSVKHIVDERGYGVMLKQRQLEGV